MIPGLSLSMAVMQIWMGASFSPPSSKFHYVYRSWGSVSGSLSKENVRRKQGFSLAICTSLAEFGGKLIKLIYTQHKDAFNIPSTCMLFGWPRRVKGACLTLCAASLDPSVVPPSSLPEINDKPISSIFVMAPTSC